ncbi:MAG: BrnA antitoxin family protein [Acidobacteriaceae bacterium]
MNATQKVKAKESSVPAKKTMRVWLDADVLAWLKKDGRGFHARANRLLRERMLKDLQGRRGEDGC